MDGNISYFKLIKDKSSKENFILFLFQFSPKELPLSFVRSLKTKIKREFI